MSAPKQRVRLYAAGQAMYRLVALDKGYTGPYSQNRCPAKWACIDCGRIIDGTDDAPDTRFNKWSGKHDNQCARNGHAPCAHCGKKLPRLNDGCPRAHNWRNCPGKTEAHRMEPQHPRPEHQPRTRP